MPEDPRRDGSAPRSVSSAFRAGQYAFDRFSTQSPAMTECLRLARAAAGTDLTVLITGESGTGKNLLAQAIHNHSPRKEQPCVLVNTTALSETLIESEIFGHEKGAFTGADRTREGRFERANKGTLVLDEIGDMSPAAQAKMLRAVEYRQFERLGGHETLQVDVRVIAITNCDLDERVAEKRFREDLLYRLREVHIHVPPLRQRLEDLPALAELFTYECTRKVNPKIKGIAAPAVELFKTQPWPGNLRELKAAIRRASMLAESGIIEPQHLGLRPQAHPPTYASGPGPMEDELSLRAAEARHVAWVLQLTQGNKRQASRLLAISRNTLDRKIAEYELELPGEG